MENAARVKIDLTSMIDIVFLLLVFFVFNLLMAAQESELRTYLPKNTRSGSGLAGCRDLNEVRVKLLWVDGAGKSTDSDQGRVLLKVGRHAYNLPGELENASTKHPAWGRLYSNLLQYKSESETRWREPFSVIIDARDRVPYRYVIQALNEVIRADVEDIFFAAPERDY